MHISRPLLSRLLALWLMLWVTLASAQKMAPIPPLTAHVTDTAGMLDAKQQATLESVLKEYETRTGSQIGILLINTTEPEAIEQYSIRVADAWKLGRKGVDDGAILVVAKDNPKALRRLRIEAGRGVQGTLTDAQSKRILQDVIAPHFRQNDYYGGLVAGVAAITNLLDQEHLPAPAAGKGKAKTAATDEFDIFSLLPYLFFGVIILGPIFLRGRGGRKSFRNDGWGHAAGVILGSGIGGGFGGGKSSGGSGGFGGFGGGGGGFDGGGASGDW